MQTQELQEQVARAILRICGAQPCKPHRALLGRLCLSGQMLNHGGRPSGRCYSWL